MTGSIALRLEHRLRESNHKLTRQRRAVLGALAEERTRHLTAEQLHRAARERLGEIGLATVYRTLDILVEMRLIRKLNLGQGCAHYELTTGQTHNHHHLLCLRCGSVSEVRGDLLEHLEDIIKADYSFTVMDHSLQFQGICGLCRNQSG